MSNIRRFGEHTPNLHPDAYIDPAAVVIGKVTVGADSSLWPCVVARGDVQSIEIGARTNIQDGSILHVSSATPTHPDGLALKIGDDVTVGHNAIVHACTIQDRVLIGMGATVLDGAVVENDVMIGAGSVVSPGKRLESGYLYMGSPARQKRALTEAEKGNLLKSAEGYAELAKVHGEPLA